MKSEEEPCIRINIRELNKIFSDELMTLYITADEMVMMVMM